ncbi:hypothetical protein N8257_00670 [Ulvibacter sp.]|nr:hypothetical protein [Ulvibacter sp.]
MHTHCYNQHSWSHKSKDPIFFDEENQALMCDFGPNKCMAGFKSSGVSLDTIKGCCEKYKIDFSSIPKDNIIIVAEDLGFLNSKNHGEYLGLRQRPFFHSDIDSILSEFKNIFTPNLKNKIHDSVYPLPMGIKLGDSEYLESLESVQRFMPRHRKKICYANFSMTSPYRIKVAEWAFRQRHIDAHIYKRYDRHGDDLRMKEEIFSKKGKLPDTEYFKELSSYKFCICPEGNGIDTFRMWECILTNTIPIAQNNYGNRIFSKIWPMILVDRYETDDIPNRMLKFLLDFPDHQYDSAWIYLRDTGFSSMIERIKNECVWS